jgi:hypothetical protein
MASEKGGGYGGGSRGDGGDGTGRGPQVHIRYPFDFGFAPNPTAPVDFVADGNNQPPGGTNFTVEGTLYAAGDVTFMTPVSNPITVNVAQGIWRMGPFTQAGTANPMLPGDYLFRVRFLQGVTQLDAYAVLTRLT